MRSSLCGLLMMIAVTLIVTDLSGRWILTLDPDFSGNPDTIDCTLNQTGGSLTADCGGGTPMSGEIKNQNVTLRFKTGDDGRATATLTGVLNQAETTITGKWHLEPDNRAGNFELKRR